MKVEFFPIDVPAPAPPHGTVFCYPQRFATLADAFAAGCPVYGYLHGKGPLDQGIGTLRELKELQGMAMFKNGVFRDPMDPLKPGAVDLEDLIWAAVQTNTGYDAGEIEFLLKKLDGYKPKFEPLLQGFSWGGWGILGNIGAGRVDPDKLSEIWLLSPGANADRIAKFIAAMKGKKTPVVIVHNENDKIAPVANSIAIFNGLKAQGNRVAFVKYKNVWTSSDGTQTSHASVAFVFPSRWWRMWTTDPAARASKVFAEIFVNDFPLTYNFYQMLKRDLDFIEPPIVVTDPDPVPVPTDPVDIGDLGIITTSSGIKLKPVMRADGIDLIIQP